MTTPEQERGESFEELLTIVATTRSSTARSPTPFNPTCVPRVCRRTGRPSTPRGTSDNPMSVARVDLGHRRLLHSRDAFEALRRPVRWDSGSELNRAGEAHPLSVNCQSSVFAYT